MFEIGVVTDAIEKFWCSFGGTRWRIRILRLEI